MPRYGLLLVVLAAAALDAQSGSNQSTAGGPSQNPPASPAVSAVAAASQPRKVELVASPTPRDLDEPFLGGASDAAGIFRVITLCDPVDCLGEAPRLVWVNGKLTVHFPDSYGKPAAEPKDATRK